jgi:hypothetical protein
MAFKLVDNEWLKTQTRKAGSIFKANLEKGTEYTQEELLAVLAANGQVYTIPEFQEIRVELKRLGVIEGEEDPPE